MQNQNKTRPVINIKCKGALYALTNFVSRWMQSQCRPVLVSLLTALAAVLQRFPWRNFALIVVLVVFAVP